MPLKATRLLLASNIGVGKYLGCQNFSARERPLGAGPPNVNLGPLSEITRARKLKLKTQLDVVKYSLRVKKYFS